MKGFFVALALLLGVATLVAVNANFVTDTQASLSRAAETISSVPSQDAVAQIQALQKEFEKAEKRLSFSINYYLLDRVSELLASLEAYAASADTAADTVAVSASYASTHKMLQDAIRDLSRLEQISLKTIF